MRLRPVRFFAMVLVLASCSPGGGGQKHTPVPALNATKAPLLPTDAEALPSFDYAEFQTLLSQLRGTPVVVNIWGSWCSPCIAEAPLLVSASKTYGHKVQFLGIDILDTRESARGFMQRHGVTYPSIYDPSATGDIRNRMGFIGQPDTVFYDSSGAKVAEWQGQISEKTLNSDIGKICVC